MTTTEKPYPRLTNAEVEEFIRCIVPANPDSAAVSTFLHKLQVSDAGHENPQLEATVVELVSACGDRVNSALEDVEAAFCARVFNALEEFSDEALGDEEFWSYLAVRYFWKFISLRQHRTWLQAQGQEDGGDEDDEDPDKGVKIERYLRGRDHYHIPLRMYLRAQAVRDGDDFSLTEIEGGSTDFWRSQVLGVRTASFPPLARAVVGVQSKAQLDIQGQRPAGRRVNRLRVNVEFVLHNEVEAADIVAPIWVVTEADAVEAAAKKATAKKKAAARKAAGTKPAPKKATAAKKAPAKKAAD